MIKNCFNFTIIVLNDSNIYFQLRIEHYVGLHVHRVHHFHRVHNVLNAHNHVQNFQHVQPVQHVPPAPRVPHVLHVPHVYLPEFLQCVPHVQRIIRRVLVQRVHHPFRRVTIVLQVYRVEHVLRVPYAKCVIHVLHATMQGTAPSEPQQKDASIFHITIVSCRMYILNYTLSLISYNIIDIRRD